MAGRLTISTLNDDSGVLATQNGMTGIAKAWVNFNGSNGSIRGSFNVSSVTRGNTGTYTVNFTTAMSNINYSVSGSCIANGTSAYGGTLNMFNGNALATVAPTTSAFSFLTTSQPGTLYDPTYVCVSVSGN